ncbi:hypothetical protein Tco_0802470 [Tanacetum coccineum]|uniref:Uncharacterized protein n=1 Tax=Tanacetum coccineum TaxID=301880 RepID=A0ABQ5A313_9ASTR
MQLSELMLLCTNLQKHVLDLEKAKDAQAKEITVLKKRVQKHNEDLMFDTGVLDSDEMFVDATTGEKEEQSTKVDAMEVSTAEPVTTDVEVVTTASEAVSTAGVEDSVAPIILVTTAATTLQISKDELTLAKTLMEIKAAKPKVVTTAATTVSTESKAKGVSIQEPSKTTTRAVITPSKVQAKDKGKAIMVEPEIPLKKKDQIALDAELAFKLHAEEQAELEKIQKERNAQEEVNIAIIEKWNEVQAKIEADMELTQRLQSEEQEQYNNEEKAKLFMELLEKKRKFFARKKEIEKRNRPPTKAQQRNLIYEKDKYFCGYGYGYRDVREKSGKTQQKLLKAVLKECGDELGI